MKAQILKIAGCKTEKEFYSKYPSQKDFMQEHGETFNNLRKSSSGINNPRKKYANGTNTQGVGPNNYIQSPNEVLNDYNIMLAEADKQVASNSVVPIVSLVGGLLQQGIGMAGSFKKTPTTAANGMNNVNSDVEVEGGEMYETPQGETGEFKGPSHEQGGIPMEVNQDIPEGTKVYSDRLKIGKETLAERKEARERKIANLEKIAAQPLVDSALKNATKRKMMAIEKEEMADLQFQEQVNNMQHMSDTMVKAFGTSMAGVQDNPVGDSMRYAMGTGADGVTEYGNGGMIFGKGYNLSNFKPYLDKYSNSLGGMQPNIDWGDPNNVKAFQRSLGNTEDGVLGKNDYAKASGLKTPETTFSSIMNNFNTGTKSPVVNTGAYDASGFVQGFGREAEEAAENPLYYNTNPSTNFTLDKEETIKTVENPEGTVVSKGLEKGSGAMNFPGVGDLASLFGDYLGATSGLKNAAEQRSTDVTHTNVYQNAGRETQKQLDNAMSSIEGSKAQAIAKATTTTQGGKRSGRNSARGVNQMRGMDWLYDTALNQQIADISANAANQVADIYKTKASTALNVDQLKGQGQYQANMANEAAKDAYYTAKGLGLKDQSLGIQNIGKDLNDRKENAVKWNIAKKSGIYGQGNDEGDIESKQIQVIDPATGKKVSISMAEYQKFISQSTKSK
jgi:hypothetical protein